MSIQPHNSLEFLYDGAETKAIAGGGAVKPAKTMATTLATLAMVVALTACNSKPVVGVLLPMTGEASTYGESMKRGIDLALEMDQDVIPAGFKVLWGDTAIRSGNRRRRDEASRGRGCSAVRGRHHQ